MIKNIVVDFNEMVAIKKETEDALAELKDKFLVAWEEEFISELFSEVGDESYDLFVNEIMLDLAEDKSVLSILNDTPVNNINLGVSFKVNGDKLTISLEISGSGGYNWKKIAETIIIRNNNGGGSLHTVWWSDSKQESIIALGSFLTILKEEGLFSVKVKAVKGFRELIEKEQVHTSKIDSVLRKYKGEF